jgi:hypothetical protein
MNANLNADFCIAIDFKRDSEAPSRVFRTLSELIEAFHEFDLDLVQSVDSKIEPVILLEDIEIGSIKTWLRYALQNTEDDALKTLDWKPQVGKYLIKAKYAVIKFLDNKTEISNRSQLQELEGELLKLAQETDVKHIPAYAPLSRKKLIQNIDRISTATHYLLPDDKAKFMTRTEEVPFNVEFKIVPEAIEDLLTKESIESSGDMILKVKKPDYLGDSRWEFKHENRTIPMKIVDLDWLEKFQSRQVDIRPGDSVRATVLVTTNYDHELNVISIHHDIVEVKEIIVLPEQQPLL